jgi:hypothetical protein
MPTDSYWMGLILMDTFSLQRIILVSNYTATSLWNNWHTTCWNTNDKNNKHTNSMALSPQANYTDWAATFHQQNLVPTFVDRGVSRGQRGGTHKQNSVALSPRANYTDWATATCRRNLVSIFVDRGVSRGQRGVSPTVVNLSFLDRSRYFSFK